MANVMTNTAGQMASRLAGISSKFDVATLRLTAWYLGVLMFISVIFSAALYQVSSRELSEGLRSQVGIIRRVEPLTLVSPNDLLRLQEAAIRQARGQLQARLIMGNIVILVTGGMASYWFARRTLRPIETSMQRQTRFTADASHELRTPLTAMRTEIEVALRDKALNLNEARLLLASNLEEIAKLENLSASLLNLASYDEGVPRAQLAKVRLDKLAAGVVGEVCARLASSKISIQLSAKPIIVRGEAAALAELLQILLDNAVKYSPDGGDVAVNMRTQNGHAVLSVRDHGLGIKAADLPHIFERFYRADVARNKADIGGYGLGLSIAKSIAEVHGGSIGAMSKLGKGSTFIVRLPLLRPNPLAGSKPG